MTIGTFQAARRINRQGAPTGLINLAGTRFLQTVRASRRQEVLTDAGAVGDQEFRSSEDWRIGGAFRHCNSLSLLPAPNPTGFCAPSEASVYNPQRGRRRETQARRADIIVARRTKSIFEPRRGDITKSPDPEDAAAKPKPDPATTQPDRVLCSLRGVGFNRCRGCPEGVA